MVSGGQRQLDRRELVGAGAVSADCTRDPIEREVRQRS